CGRTSIRPATWRCWSTRPAPACAISTTWSRPRAPARARPDKPRRSQRLPMPVAASRTDPGRDLVASALEAADPAEARLADASLAVRRRVTRDGKVAARLIDREQRATH